jgi:hypothetical protein
MSEFQSLKLVLLGLIPISRDGFHAAIGILAYVVSVTFLRRSPRTFGALRLGLVVALLIETIDFVDDLRFSAPTRLGDSAKDILVTCAAPLLFVFAARQFGKPEAPPDAARSTE